MHDAPAHPAVKRYQFEPIKACNMCGSARAKMLGMRLSGSQGFSPGKTEGIAVPIKRCLDCGLIYSDPQPIPDSLSDHYGVPPEDYWRAEAIKSWNPAYFDRQIKAAKELISFSPGMKALDIGVGLGKAMKSLSEAGFDTWGIEPSSPFRLRAIDTLGINPDRIQQSPMEEADYPDHFFDFITFGAVLEHLYDPHAALRRALNWLKPGGVIHAEVPNSDHLIAKVINLFFRLRGTNYVTHLSPMHPPYHLHEFTLASFKDFDVVRHWIEVCTIFHLPKFLHPPLRWWMKRTRTGMQITIFVTHQGSRSHR
ncbi:MAG TPA: class I SAM-dependent methyltransferase [Sphingomicrobium sp.]|nr:class I SAM-dependent methyltransferase [Sphingomicrobium sp.]